jgi:hypothetical protein
MRNNMYKVFTTNGKVNEQLKFLQTHVVLFLVRLSDLLLSEPLVISNFI